VPDRAFAPDRHCLLDRGVGIEPNAKLVWGDAVALPFVRELQRAIHIGRELVLELSPGLCCGHPAEIDTGHGHALVNAALMPEGVQRQSCYQGE
jgi:hypothetical protein